MSSKIIKARVTITRKASLTDGDDIHQRGTDCETRKADTYDGDRRLTDKPRVAPQSPDDILVQMHLHGLCSTAPDAAVLTYERESPL